MGALGNLALDNGNRDAMFDHGFGTMVVAAVDHWKMYPEVVRNAYFCIGNLSVRKRQATELLRLGMLGKSIATLREYKNERALLNQVCQGLRNFTHVERTVGADFAAMGGLDVLMEILWRYKDNPLPESHGLLLNLTASGCFELLADRGLFSYMAHSLYNFGFRPQTMILTRTDMSILCNMAWHHLRGEEFWKHGLVDLVIKILRLRWDEPQLHDPGAVFFGQLARGFPDYQKRLVDAGVLDLLLSDLVTFPTLTRVDDDEEGKLDVSRVVDSIAWALSMFADTHLTYERVASFFFSNSRQSSSHSSEASTVKFPEEDAGSTLAETSTISPFLGHPGISSSSATLTSARIAAFRMAYELLPPECWPSALEGFYRSTSTSIR